MLQTSAHWETVIINIKGSIIPSVKFKAVSQLKTHPRKLVRTIFLWCFLGKKIGVTKPVYATVLTVKVTEFIGFWYPHPTNFD